MIIKQLFFKLLQLYSQLKSEQNIQIIPIITQLNNATV